MGEQMNENTRPRIVMLGCAVAVLLTAPLLISAPHYVEVRTPDDGLTWLHVDGKYIKNADDEVVWLRGAAFPDLSFKTTWGGWLTRGGWDAFVNLSEGRANVVRVPMSQAALMQGVDPSEFNDAVDQLVALAKRDRVYLILEFHGGLTWENTYALAQNPAPLAEWWVHWANRYKDEPTVAGFEIYNEPWPDAFAGGQGYDASVTNWVKVATHVVNAITLVNPRALIIVASVPFGMPMQYWLDNPLPFNVVYGWDQYYRGWDEWHKQPYRDEDWDLAYDRTYDMLYHYGPGKAAVAYNLPVFGTEFGWVPATPERDPAWEVSMGHWLSILNQFETHWYYWYFPFSNSQGSILSQDLTELAPPGEIWFKHLAPTHPQGISSQPIEKAPPAPDITASERAPPTVGLCENEEVVSIKEIRTVYR